MVTARLAQIGRTDSLTVTQKQMTLRARLHFGPTFFHGYCTQSELRSSGASRWTRHGLENMEMPLQALCVFKHRTLSLHPCCVCVCESFSLTSVGRNDWLTVHGGCLITHIKFWKDLTFLTLRNSTYETILMHFRFTQEVESEHISSFG